MGKDMLEWCGVFGGIQISCTIIMYWIYNIGMREISHGVSGQPAEVEQRQDEEWAH